MTDDFDKTFMQAISYSPKKFDELKEEVDALNDELRDALAEIETLEKDKAHLDDEIHDAWSAVDASSLSYHNTRRNRFRDSLAGYIEEVLESAEEQIRQLQLEIDELKSYHSKELQPLD